MKADASFANILTPCGVDVNQFEVEWDEICQEHVFTFSGSTYSESTLACLAERHLRFPSRFIFLYSELQDAFDKAVSESPAMLLARDKSLAHLQEKLEAHGLSKFQPYRPDQKSLVEFAERAETACSFGRGEILSVEAETIYAHPSESTKTRLDDLAMLLSILG